MINNILFPTDFSAVAEQALKYAISLCDKCEAEIHILHVKQIPLTDPSFPADTFQNYVNEIEAFEKEKWNELEQKIIIPSGIKHTFHSVTGFVADEVVQFSDLNSIDLIIMGTTGASGLAEILIGSNTASVVGKTSTPLLVIPPSAGYAPLQHILYATDFSEPEYPAISRIIYFAEIFDAKLTILHVKTEFDRYFNSANHFLNKNKDNITREYTLIHLDDQDVFEAIDKFVNQEAIDLLVMAKHKRSFFDRLFHRSLSKRMAYHTKVPLLILNK
ncbi:MAG: universal stress protein [Bacteroidia bacterium]|jgi:nucleotide-binding universal stress UspA family protein|nr:universal stress protein [Bacteroidia bacterium]